jgi:RNA recognition motif-containing protein
MFHCLQVFVGGLDPSVTDELLRQTFSPYGELLYVKIPAGKRCGFVQYSNRYKSFFCAVIG